VQNSAVELDHVFMYAPRESPEEEVVQTLREAGLIVDDTRSEFPDGVVGRYVYFANAYLEVLWLEPNSRTGSATSRRAMWQTTQVSPFGVGLRRRKGAPEELPFPTRSEVAEWMRPGTEMRILTQDDEVLAPKLFVVPDYMAMTSWPPDSSDLSSSLGGRELTGVRVTTLSAGFPKLADVLVSAEVRMERGEEPLIELYIGAGHWETRRDLRPVLPVVLWQ
jgi:hypothetical protein